MLNPGDRCPCCGSIIPGTISIEALTLLRLMDTREQYEGGAISQTEYNSHVQAALHEYNALKI